MRSILDALRSVRSPSDLIPHHPGRRAAGLAALALIVVAAVAIGLDGGVPPTPTPAPTPVPSIVAETDSEIGVLAGGTDTAAATVAEAARHLLSDLYERAFLPPLPPPQASGDGPTPEVAPTPVPRLPPEDYFLEPARTVFLADRSPFAPAQDETVHRGRVGFHGAVFADGEAIQGALLAVRFEGEASIALPDGTRPGRFVQHGQLLIVPTDAGWRIAGFDVALEVHRHPPPTPRPSPRAARWMP